ncbi:hypothetical protein Tco_0803900 [Tanacetum coccineum]|uniref:Uncharacterized protein n=1 Tax=Tanacetum coccineum TaxID=301880 RepID=A0ABQ5A3U0_9ASTR
MKRTLMRILRTILPIKRQILMMISGYDECEKDEEDGEEEEHLAPADPSAVPTNDLEIEQVVAQRVANAIEAIAIYETKTNMARNHKWQCTGKFGIARRLTTHHLAQDCRNPAAARNQQTHACYECGSLRHFQDDVPIVKFQKRVDKKIRTLAERQTKNKRKFENTSRNSQNQQQQQIKRQNTGRAYTAGSGDKKPYGGSRPLCSKYGKRPICNNQKGHCGKSEALLGWWESRALQEGLPRAKEPKP